MDILTQKCIDSATVVPHWLPDEKVFWYRRYLEPGKFQFIIVDAEQKSRVPAFDHEKLAKALGDQTGETIDGDALPFQWIEPATEPSGVRFQFSSRKWQYGPDNRLQEWEGSFTQGTSSLLQKEVPSPNSRDQISVDFVNRTGTTLKMFWIDWDGKPIFYNIIGIGKTERQSTYVGHVWRLVDASTGMVKAIYSAPDQGNDIIIIEDFGDLPDDACLPEDFQASVDKAESSNSDNDGPIIIRDFNVWLLKQDGQEIQLSTNGTEDNPYDEERVYLPSDRRHAIVWQYVASQDHELNLIESSPDDRLEPKLHTVQYLKPGDRKRVDRPRLFDPENKCEISTDDSLFENPYLLRNLGWNETQDEYRFFFNERGHSHLRIIGINLAGQVRAIVEESSETFVDYTKLHFEILSSEEMLWSSERDGYNHLYLINLAQGVVKTQITKGEWNVNAVESVDKEQRRILFRGYGLQHNEDPCYAHLASVNFDGSEFRILTNGDGTHSWTWSPSKGYLLDTWSRVDLPPRTVLRDGKSGETVVELEGIDIKSLEDEIEWDPPERFSTFGRDGKTLIYGIMVRPPNFDKNKMYPVIDDIYAGPQDFFTPKAFAALRGQRKWASQGYILVQIDGMGTNWRSKAFHDVCYKNLRDSGLPDHISWLQAAAETRPWMDLSRVGIMGSSAGGQSAVSALLHHNHFYKAAAADSGCHDNRMDKMWWNELWMGWPVDEAYVDSSNITHAAKLKGALMLIVGALDDNVDPSSTMQLANALNKANKYYELLFIPSGEHGCGGTPYGLARQRDFFRRHLQQRSDYLASADILDI